VNGLAGTRMPRCRPTASAKWLDVANGTTINIKSKVAVTAGKTIYITAELGDFT
jgi:hypothetical protein